jgi:hypothetical protein
VNTHQRDAGRFETIGFERKVQLVARRQHHHVGVRRQIAGGRLAGSVGDVRSLNAARQIPTDQDVVCDRIGGCQLAG